MSLNKFLNELNIPFKNIDLYEEAFHHPSKKINGKDYQRLEFLGDRIISFLVAEKLFLDNPNSPEGDLTVRQALLVDKTNLSLIGEKLQLNEHLISISNDIADNPKMKCDVFEALIGAIYLDLGLDFVKEFLLKQLNFKINFNKDPKSKLQEYLQAEKNQNPEYRLINEEGPDHKKIFTVEVILDGQSFGLGTGKSKQEAEKDAALVALRKLAH
jgi:ribonuclease-3